MPTTTPNNAWPVPVSTDLVKDGALAIETLGDAIDTSVGTGLLAWTAYTPTFNGVTIGNGTTSFWYNKIGKTVFVKGKFTLGSTSAITGVVSASLPVTARTNIAAFQALGTCSLFNASVLYFGQSFYNNNTIGLQASSASGTFVTGTPLAFNVPFTWAATHSFSIECTYEAA
jgi:hypothetical protein